jgi:hypothetical protein
MRTCMSGARLAAGASCGIADSSLIVPAACGTCAAGSHAASRTRWARAAGASAAREYSAPTASEEKTASSASRSASVPAPCSKVGPEASRRVAAAAASASKRAGDGGWASSGVSSAAAIVRSAAGGASTSMAHRRSLSTCSGEGGSGVSCVFCQATPCFVGVRKKKKSGERGKRGGGSVDQHCA